jgi:HlyD family secretion protein
MSKIVAFLTTKIGIALAASAVVAVGAYAAFSDNGAKFEVLTVKADDFIQQVSVSGTVVPVQQVELGFTQSGRISRVNVKVGDHVPAGRVLAEIDGGDLYAQLLQKEAALDVQKAKLLSLQQGTRPEELAVAEADVASDESALAQASAALADSLRDAYIKTDDAIRNKVYQFVSNPRTNPQINIVSSDTQAVIDIRSSIIETETALFAWAADNASLDVSSDLAASVANAREYMNKATTLLYTVSRVLNSASLTNISQTTLDSYITAVATGRTNVSTASAALTTAVTAQKNAAAALESSRRTLALKKAGTVQADIDAQAAQVKSAEADVASSRAMLAKTRITAPFAGVVTRVDAKIGKIVSPNTPEISIISASAFQIESYIPEVNIAYVKVGDTAVITLDAYGSEVPFHAKVVSIDPAETVRDGVATYRALLQFDAEDARIRSGMTANIVLTTAEKSGVVSIPQGLVTERNGKKYVKVLDEDGETVIEHAVTTGAVSSLGNIEILSGLGEGDVLIVSEAK